MYKLLLRTYVLFLALTTSIIVNATVINGSNIYDVYGSEAWLYGHDNSTINIHKGSNVSWSYGYNNSTINIYKGSNVSWLYGYDNARINVFGGNISWLKLYDQNVTNITGVEDLGWLLVNDKSEVNIFGTGFSYTNGHLSGLWENGLSFSFWALNETDLMSGNISSVLPENIRLHSISVPEPGAMFLLVIGLAIVSYKTKLKM